MTETHVEQTVRDFAEIYWADRDGSFFPNTWLGLQTLQHPFDVWMTQEIITEVEPEVIVEVGGFRGGSAALGDDPAADRPHGRGGRGRPRRPMAHARALPSRGDGRVPPRSTVDPAIVARVRDSSAAAGRW